jgi:3-oxoacid CoA-transferase subunit B
MQHCAPDGSPKVLKNCKLPLTGKNCVKKIISDRAAMVVTAEGLVVTEIIPGLSFEELQACTEARLLKSPEGIKVLNP